MYDKKKINELAYRYIKTESDEVFEELIGELIYLIDKQLYKYHLDLKNHWDDLRQRILVRLWRVRKSLGSASSESLYVYLYRTIQQYGIEEKEKIKKKYDEYKLFCVPIDSVLVDKEDEWD